MKKRNLKKAGLFAACLALAATAAVGLTACGNNDGPAQNNNPPVNMNEKYSVALKNVGERLIENMTNTPATLKLDASEDAPVYFAWSATLVYYLGLLYEDFRFNATEYPVFMEGSFDYLTETDSVDYTEYMNKTLLASFDVENNGISVFFGQKYVLGSENEDYLYFDIGYDFDSEQLKSFAYSTKIEDGVSTIHFDGENYWEIERNDGEYSNYLNTFNAQFARFTALRDTKTVTVAEDGVNKYATAAMRCFELMGSPVKIVPHKGE